MTLGFVFYFKSVSALYQGLSEDIVPLSCGIDCKS